MSEARPVGDITGRIRTRRRAGRMRWVLRAAGLALALVLLTVAGLLVAWSSAMSAHRVRVSGLETIAEERIVSAAGVPIGSPLVRIRPREIAERVARVPEVATVTVRAVLPDTVEIRVSERRPALVAELPAGLTLVDAGGSAFRHVDQAPKGLVRAKPAAPPSAALLRDLATVVAALPSDWRGAVLAADSRDHITLTLPSGQLIVWGSAEDSAAKAGVARRLVAAVQAKVYDVAAPSRPVTR